MYASLTSYQYSSSLTALYAEGYPAQTPQLPVAGGESGKSDMSGYPFASRANDFLDIQQNLMEELQQASLDLAKSVATSPQSIEEQLAAFQEKVGDIFSQLMEDIQGMVSNGDMSGMGDKVNGAGQNYFALQMSVSVEVRITVAQQQPADSDLAQQAVEAVSGASLSRQDKADLLKMIAMVDEFVRTESHGNILRSVLRLVPMMEDITPPSRVDDSEFASLDQAMGYYNSQRENLRASVGPIGQMMHEERGGQGTNGYSRQALSVSYEQSSVSILSTSA